MSDARRALAFLTPIGGAAVPTPAALAWFPAVGAGMGAVLGTAWWGLARVWPMPVDAAVVVALDLGLTGMLHLDGVADAADGLLPHLSRERRLAVMREPTIGAFGVAAAGVALLARWAALDSARPSVLLLVGLWCASRTMMAVVAATVPYARAGEGGIASAFLGAPGAGAPGTAPPGAGAGAGAGPTRAGVLAGCAGAPAAIAAVVGFGLLAGPVSLACGLAAAVVVVLLAVRRVGGFTGDVLGAAGVTLETVGLVVAAARW